MILKHAGTAGIAIAIVLGHVCASTAEDRQTEHDGYYLFISMTIDEALTIHANKQNKFFAKVDPGYQQGFTQIQFTQWFQKTRQAMIAKALDAGARKKILAKLNGELGFRPNGETTLRVKHLDNKGTAALARTNWPGIDRLVITNAELDNKDVGALTVAFPNLKSFSASFKPEFQGNGRTFAAALVKFERLDSITLQYAENFIDDAAVLELLELKHKLAHLNLNGCGITMKTATLIPQHFGKLKYVNIGAGKVKGGAFGAEFTMRLFHQYRNNLPDLETLRLDGRQPTKAVNDAIQQFNKSRHVSETGN